MMKWIRRLVKDPDEPVTNQSPPPATLPAGVPSGDDPGLRTIRYVFETMQIDAQWSQWSERGFVWWGHELAQRVWVDEPYESLGELIYRVQAETDFLRGDVNDPKVGEVLAKLGGLGSLSGVVLDQGAGLVRLRCAAFVHVQNEAWLRWLFRHGVALQAADAQQQASLVARLTGLEPATSVHPTSGTRREPDDMLNIVQADAARFASGGSRWTDPPKFAQVAELLRRNGVHANAGDDGLTAEFGFGAHPGPVIVGGNSTLLQLSTEPNPRYGPGLLLRLSLPIYELAGSPRSLPLALNALEPSTRENGHFLGSWCVAPNKRKPLVTFVSFMPNSCFSPGAQLENMVMSLAMRAQWASDRLNEAQELLGNDGQHTRLFPAAHALAGTGWRDANRVSIDWQHDPEIVLMAEISRRLNPIVLSAMETSAGGGDPTPHRPSGRNDSQVGQDLRDAIHTLAAEGARYSLLRGEYEIVRQVAHDVASLEVPPWEDTAQGLDIEALQALEARIPIDTNSAPPSAVLVVATSGGDYTSIVAAVAAAPPGAQITVHAGIYREPTPLVLDSPITIVAENVRAPGAGGAPRKGKSGRTAGVVIETPAGRCVTMQTERAVLRGLTLRATGASTGEEHAVYVAEGELVIEDCSVTTVSGAGLCLSNPEARATLRRCTIKESPGGGVLALMGARVMLEDCDLAANAKAGLMCAYGAVALVQRCRIHDGLDLGILFADHGRGLMEECEVFGNEQAGIEVVNAVDPTFRHCRIFEGKHYGLYAHGEAGGTYQDCEIYGNANTGVQVEDGGAPLLLRCTIRDGRNMGVVVQGPATGTFVHCAITGNAQANLWTGGPGSSPRLRWCHIRDGQKHGFIAWKGGGGTLEDCEIANNATGDVLVESEAVPVLKRCTVRSSESGGVFFSKGGLGVLEDCDISGEPKILLRITSSANPLLRRCRVTGGQLGVHVRDGGAGSLEDCEVTGSGLSRMVVIEKGAPIVRGCRFRDDTGVGLLVFSEGTGTFDKCEFAGAGEGSVVISHAGDPLLRGCTIAAASHIGVLVHDRGLGRLHECTISASAGAGVELRTEGSPLIKTCRITGNAGPGVWAHDGGAGTIQDCEVTGNTQGAWRLDAGTRVQRRGNRD